MSKKFKCPHCGGKLYAVNEIFKGWYIVEVEDDGTFDECDVELNIKDNECYVECTKCGKKIGDYSIDWSGFIEEDKE